MSKIILTLSNKSMRIVQTLWSRNKADILCSSSGWLAPEYNLMSWCLSCLQLRKFYNEVVLYADSQSANLLIDQLQLPYTEVVCNLDEFCICHQDLWALAKIHTYSQQRGPFLHVDGDVFVWSHFDEKLIGSALIAQSLEKASSLYRRIIISLQKGLPSLPEWFMKINPTEPFYSYNAGILGGHDIDFFHQYCEEANDMINRNRYHLNNINVVDFNICFEQCLFYSLAFAQNKKVALLLEKITDDGLYEDMDNFKEVPFKCSLFTSYRQLQTLRKRVQ